MDDNTKLVWFAVIALFASQILPMVQAHLNRLASAKEHLSTATHVEQIRQDVDVVRKDVNGRMGQLITAVTGQAQAEGELKGAADEQARVK